MQTCKLHYLSLNLVKSPYALHSNILWISVHMGADSLHSKNIALYQVDISTQYFSSTWQLDQSFFVFVFLSVVESPPPISNLKSYIQPYSDNFQSILPSVSVSTESPPPPPVVTL